MTIDSQFAPIVVIRDDSTSQIIRPLSLQAMVGAHAYDEAWVQKLIFTHPETLPIGELDSSFGPLVPICMEFDTRQAGVIDALFANHLGLLTITEFKLWRNPQSRREVIGQILDYARVLRRWTYADLQREVSRTLKRPGDNAVFELVKRRHPDLDEARFIDNVSRCLRQGRFLLVLVGDGIREGVESIASYVQEHAGLHFTLGLVETAIYDIGEGRRIVQPRVLARTLIVNRSVVELSETGLVVADPAKQADEEDREPTEVEVFYRSFWSELLRTIKLDEVEQPLPGPSSQGNIYFMLPTKGNMWVTAYFSQRNRTIGVFLGWSRGSSVAREVYARLEADRTAVEHELGLPVEWTREKDGKLTVGSKKAYASLYDPSNRQDQLAWFRSANNRFVSVFRPRVAALWREVSAGGE